MRMTSKQAEHKWFLIKPGHMTFSSRLKATTKKQAWQKTLAKWRLLSKGYTFAKTDDLKAVTTCGLCDLYISGTLTRSKCSNCPIYEYMGKRCGQLINIWNHGNEYSLKFLRAVYRYDQKLELSCLRDMYRTAK